MSFSSHKQGLRLEDERGRGLLKGENGAAYRRATRLNSVMTSNFVVWLIAKAITTFVPTNFLHTLSIVLATQSSLKFLTWTRRDCRIFFVTLRSLISSLLLFSILLCFFLQNTCLVLISQSLLFSYPISSLIGGTILILYMSNRTNFSSIPHTSPSQSISFSRPSLPKAFSFSFYYLTFTE
jgi:hypothetical protein